MISWEQPSLIHLTCGPHANQETKPPVWNTGPYFFTTWFPNGFCVPHVESVRVGQTLLSIDFFWTLSSWSSHHCRLGGFFIWVKSPYGGSYPINMRRTHGALANCIIYSLWNIIYDVCGFATVWNTGPPFFKNGPAASPRRPRVSHGFNCTFRI